MIQEFQGSLHLMILDCQEGLLLMIQDQNLPLSGFILLKKVLKMIQGNQEVQFPRHYRPGQYLP